MDNGEDEDDCPELVSSSENSDCEEACDSAADKNADEKKGIGDGCIGMEPESLSMGVWEKLTGLKNAEDNPSDESLPELVSEDDEDEEHKKGMCAEATEELLSLSRSRCPESTINLQVKKEAPTEEISHHQNWPKDAISNATEAFLNHRYQESIVFFEEAGIATVYKEDFDSEKIFLLAYTYGSACLNCGNVESLNKALKVFEQILQHCSSNYFSFAYYGLCRVYCKFNRYKIALENVQAGLDALTILDVSLSSVYRWPESTVDIEESKPGHLKAALDDLNKLCQNPPRPNAVCRFDKCENHVQTEIYISDPDFKGYIQIRCKENCCLSYHLNCWKIAKDEYGKSNDKDFLEADCLTPDCGSSLIEIVHFDDKGEIAKQFKPIQKNEVPAKTKQKKRQEKKEAKKKAKKHAETIASQSSKCEQKKTVSPSQNLPVEPSVSHAKKESDTFQSGEPVVSSKISSIPSLPVNKLIDLDSAVVYKKQSYEKDERDQHQKDRPDRRKVKKVITKTWDELFERPEEISEDQAKVVDAYQHSRPDGDFCQSIWPPLDENDDMMLDPEENMKHHIWQTLKHFLTIHGPIHVHDAQLLHEIAKLEPEYQELILLSGGIQDFVAESDWFVIINDDIYLAQQQDLLVHSESDHPLRSGARPDVTSSHGTMSMLDSFDSPVPDMAFQVRSVPVEGNDSIPFDKGSSEDVVAHKHLDMKSLTSSTDTVNLSHSGESESNVDSNATSDNFEGEPNLFENVHAMHALKESAGQRSSSELKQENHNKYFLFFKKFLKFIPSFSELAQKELLCLVLNVITQEQILLRYQNENNVSMDVEGLEKSFRLAANALNTKIHRSTQTGLSGDDPALTKKVKKLEETNATLQAELANYPILMNELHQSRVYQIQYQQNYGIIQEAVKVLNSNLSTSQQKCASLEKEKKDLETQIQRLQQELSHFQSSNGNSEPYKETNWFDFPEGQKVKEEQKLVTNAECIGRPHSAISDRLLENSKQPPLPSMRPLPKVLASETRASELSQTPSRNSFEKVMVQLQMRFPGYNRLQLRNFVHQLRASRQNSLTGLTIEAIIAEVSNLIVVTEQQEITRSTSMSNHSLMGLDRIADTDNAWQLVGKKSSWKSQEADGHGICVICHEEIATRDLSLLQCQHSFHNKCIRDWFRRQSTCPTCRVHSLLPDDYPTLS